MPAKAAWTPDDANCVSRGLMAWVTPLAITGARRPLQESDLPAPSKDLDAEKIGRSAQALWEAELAKHGDKAKLWRVLWKVSRKTWIQGGLLLMLSGFCNALGRPLLLMYAVRSLDPANASLDVAFGFAAAIGALLFLENWSKSIGMQLACYKGIIRSAAACQQLVTHKAIHLRTGAASDGKEAVLIGGDILGVAEFAIYTPQLLIGVISLVCGIFILTFTIGPVGLLGVGFMTLTTLVSAPLGLRVKKEQDKQRTAAEHLATAMREALDGVKVVKMMGWEEAYLERLRQRRAKEVSHIRMMRALTNVVLQAGRCAPPVGTMFTVIGYVSATGRLRADLVMPVISIFQTLRLPFIFLPLAYQLIIVVKIALRRVESYLRLPEHVPTTAPPAGSEVLLTLRNATLGWPKAVKEAAAKTPGTKEKASTRPSPSLAPRRLSMLAVDLSKFRAKREADLDRGSRAVSTTKTIGRTQGDDGSVAATASPAAAPATSEAEDVPKIPVLTDVSVALSPGSIVGVVGHVSAGKTSLLAAAWGDAFVLDGELAVTRQIAMVPQKPFTIAGTLIENILMGRDLDSAKLQSVLESTALVPDLAQLPNAEHTEVGERGVTLSGGQQQRIALARALYGQPALLLLDDPLSAVDTRTAHALLTTLTEYVTAEGTTRAAMLTVTQAHHLAPLDRLLVLDGGSRGLLRDGSVDALMSETDGPVGKLFSSTTAAVDNLTAVDASEDQSPPAAVPATSTVTVAPAPAAAAPAAARAAAPVAAALVTRERTAQGGYGLRLFKQYLRALGIPHMILYAVVLVCAFALYLFADLWLVAWIRSSEAEIEQASLTIVNQTSAPVASSDGRNSGLTLSWTSLKESTYLGVYVGVVSLHAVLIIAGSLIMVKSSANASLTLHGDVTRKLLYAPMSWYDATPSGRVLSRLSADLVIIDQKLAQDVDTWLQMVGMVVTLLAYVMASSWILALICFVIIGVFTVITWMADCSTREARRMATNAVSPIMTAVSEAKYGAALIRCMNFVDFFWRRQGKFVQAWSQMTYMLRAFQTWAGIASTMAIAVMSITVAFFVVGTRTERPLEASSLSLTYAVIVPYFMALTSENFVSMRTSVAAFERVVQYLELPQEPPHVLPTDPSPGKWPNGGTIEFVDVALRYRPGLPLALSEFTTCVRAGQKCGIVGRTGAGKSTLVLALFRLVEPTTGVIKVDGVDTLKMGLRALRRAITIIPQDPVLHQGTIAHNLDPFAKEDAQRLGDALERAQLPRDMLEQEVTKGGANLSSGERQLLCFARSLLENATILILDEATSNLDELSDTAVQRTLREQFTMHTVLTIAHRLLTVIDYDQLLVMGGGKLLESGSPLELLDTADGVLSSMAKALGDAGEAALREKCRLGGNQRA